MAVFSDHGTVMVGMEVQLFFCFIMGTNLESLTPGNIWTLSRFCPALVPANKRAAEAIDLSGERGGGGLVGVA